MRVSLQHISEARPGRRRTVTSALLLSTLLMAGGLLCVGTVDAAPPTNPPWVVELLAVEPQHVQLFSEGWTQQLLVTASDPVGRQFDVTHQCQFESTNAAVASVSPHGLLRAGASGSANIVIRIADRQTAVQVAVTSPSQAQSITFLNDVVPLLTKLGCNSGGCHGKATGQNGFRLSLLGFEPDFDHAALLQEGRGRRVFVGNPDLSLLLVKAIGKVPHGGGKRLEPDSDDYHVLHDWIKQGAAGPRTDDVKLQRITVHPANRVLRREGRQQLLVMAHFSDGSTRDVTRRAIYDSNLPEIATASADGVVTVQPRSGLFAIMAQFGGEIGVFQGTIPITGSDVSTTIAAIPATPYPAVDSPLYKQWQQLGVTPSPQADDATFIRRATIDVCGTLPTPDEIQEYLADSRPDKKSRLIDRLLERPEYASYFALKWADILQNRGQGYATSQQRPATTLFAAWLRDSIANNKRYDRLVSEILTATGSQERNPPTLWYRNVRTTKDYVESISQAFLGVRIQCAQCHHHPAERWSQADYYSLAAVFARVGRKGGFADAEVPTFETIYLKDEGEVRHPRTDEVMRPRPLMGADFPLSRFDDPRRAFAKWMTAPDNPFFARTMVNRMWGHFLGRGIIHPIDDARSTNPPSNPELLNALTQEFVASGFDMKHLVRVITGSYAYGLSAVPNETNREDRQSFARFYPRRLKAEVLLDGISQILEAPTQFAGGPGQFPVGTRAIDLPDENVPTHFLDVFGRPNRNSACECERTDDPALAQALELVNSKEFQGKLTAAKGYIEQLATSTQPVEQNVRDIFLRVFSRPATAEELAVATEFLAAEPDRPEAYRSLLWSLLVTNEFLFNR